MKKNITTIITLSLFLLATLIKPTNAYGQITDSHYISNKTIVYWFNINLEIVTDSTTLLNNYKINQSTNTVQSGTIKAYDKIIAKSLRKGEAFPLGIFYEYEEANQAKSFYNIGEKQNSLFESEREVYWFVLKVERRKISNSWKLIRVPAAIASGEYRFFEESLSSHLESNLIIVGPFWNHAEAEEAKRRYRLH